MANDNKIPKRLKDLMEETESYRRQIFKFDRHNDVDFIPADSIKPRKDGIYITLRCGLSGIYQIINEWRDGKWQMEACDASFTIAFSREPITLKAMDAYKNDES